MSLSPEQIAMRSTGIGASEFAAACGLSDFKRGPLHVWANKCLPHESVTSPAMEAGHRLERAIADWFAEDRQMVLRPGLETIRHAQFPWIMATPDFYIVGADEGIECKNTNDRMAHMWGVPGELRDGVQPVPADYWIQTQIQMAVLGWRRVYLCVLIGGHDHRVYPIDRDEESIAGLIEAGSRFWHDYVVPHVQPSPDGTEHASDVLKRIHARSVRPMTRADEPTIADLTALRAAEATRDEAVAAYEAARARVEARIGDAEGVEAPGLGRVTWRSAKDSQSTDWKGLAAALRPDPELVAQFTQTKPGARRFLAAWKE